MAYVMSCVGGTAFGHLEPRAREHGPRPWSNSNKMLAYLERVFGDSNRRRNAEYKFRNLHQEGQDFNTFWAKFLWLSIELDQSKTTLISDLTHKLSVEMQLQLINRDKEPTDLTAYAERCQRVYHGLKEIAHTEALERSMEECVVTEVVTPVPRYNTPRFNTKPTTIRTAKSSCQPVISERDQLIKEGRYFSCREVGHRTMDCPSKKKLMRELSMSRVTMQKLEQKEPRTKALQAEVPHAEEPLVKEKPLIVSSSMLPSDFFAEETLLATCTLGNNGEIKTTALLDTGATGYSFVDPAIARRVCDKLGIESIQLSKPKAIQGFDKKQAPSVTHAIYSTMTVQDHRETTTPMLITKLGQHQIIFGKPWMGKHGVILDMRNDQLSFWPGHYQHDVALRFPTAEPQAKKPCDEKPCAKQSPAGEQHTKKLNEKSNAEAPHAEEQGAKPRVEESTLHAKERHADKPVKILKQMSKKLPELLPYLLPNTRGVSKVMNTPRAMEPEKKRKPSTIPQKPKAEVKDEENEPKELKSEKPSVEQAGNGKPLDLAFIGGAPFLCLAKSKKPKHRAEIFAISMRNIKYQLNKGTKPLTDPKTVVPAEYHDFLDVFLKKVLDTLRPHKKYDHKIELLKDKDLASDLGHSALRGMSTPQLEFVKKFLEEHLKKRFIKASSAPCSSPILLAKKPGGGIRFCVDYQKLNSLTKKDAYPLPLIAKTIARLKKAVTFTKIDIRQTFDKLRMAVESEDATTFASRFGAYRWKVMPFGLTGCQDPR